MPRATACSTSCTTPAAPIPSSLERSAQNLSQQLLTFMLASENLMHSRTRSVSQKSVLQRLHPQGLALLLSELGSPIRLEDPGLQNDA